MHHILLDKSQTKKKIQIQGDTDSIVEVVHVLRENVGVTLEILRKCRDQAHWEWDGTTGTCNRLEVYDGALGSGLTSLGVSGFCVE